MGQSHSRVCPTASVTLDLAQSKLSGGFGFHADTRNRSGPSPPPLNGLQGFRAMLLAARLHGSPIQVIAHCILSSTGHQIPRAAVIAAKPVAKRRTGTDRRR